MQLVKTLNTYRGAFVWGVILLGAMPGGYLTSLWFLDLLGINPFETLIAFTGQWCVYFLMLTLLITPLRQSFTYACKKAGANYGYKLSHWSFLFLARKSLGNYTLFYGVAHAWVYMYLELSWDWLEAGLDILERPFIAFGVVGFIGLVVLGATSPKRIQHALGHYWRKIHYLVYVVTLFVLVHLLLEQKPNTPVPWFEVLVLGFMLLFRLGHLVKRKIHHYTLRQKCRKPPACG